MSGASASRTSVSRALAIGSSREPPGDRQPLRWAVILRLYHYTRPYVLKWRCLLLLVVLRSLQLPALTWLVAATISGPIATHDMAGVARGALAFTTLAVSTQLVLHFRQRLALELGEDVVHDLRRDVFAHLHSLPLGQLHSLPLGSIISRMTSDVERVRSGVQDVFFVSVVLAGQMAFTAACMCWYDPTLFGIVLLSAPLLWLTNRRFHRRMSTALRAARESLGRVTSTLAESVHGVRVTQAFARQDTNAAIFRDLIEDHARRNLAVTKTQAIYLPLVELHCQACLAALLLAGSYRALGAAGGDLGNLLAFLIMANLFLAPITLFEHQYNQALGAMAGAERVFRLLDTKPEWRDAADAVDLAPLSARIEFRRVSFRYQPDRPVLDDISFVAEPGQTLALVGPTGSGKTTIGSLIAKLIQPDSGEVLVDGHDLAAATSASLHRQLAVVPQQNFLFHGTILDNIRFARPDATGDNVVVALQRLDCLDLFESLPAGLRTTVGERGASLSLGQRQLVCFARAMLVDPRILILDEATSSVNPWTERRLQQAFRQLVTGRTSIIIAHRLDTVRRADSIVVLASGRIVERGKHHELLAAGGVYARLYHSCSGRETAPE